MKKRDIAIFFAGMVLTFVVLNLSLMSIVFKREDNSFEGLTKKIAKFEYQLGSMYFQRGDLNFKEKKYKATITDFERAQQILNKSSFFSNEIGCVSKLDNLTNKISKEPKNYKNYLERAELANVLSDMTYSKKAYCSDYPSAIADYQKVIELKPNLAQAYIGRADALDGSLRPMCKFCEKKLDETTLKTYNRIIEDYKKAGELSGYDNALYEKLGDAYFGMNDYKNALKSYQKIDNLYKNDNFKVILKLSDDSLDIPYDKVEVRVAKAKYLDKDYTEAANEYLKIAGYFEDKDILARIYNECGKIEYDRKDINASLKHYKKALEYTDGKTSKFVYRNKAKVDWKLGYYFNFFQDIIRGF